MVAEFAAAIHEGRRRRTDGRAGLRVLSVLEAAGSQPAPPDGAPSWTSRPRSPRWSWSDDHSGRGPRPGDRRGRHDRLDDRRPAPRRRSCPRRRARQPGPRSAGQPRRRAGLRPGLTWSRATSATGTWSTTWSAASDLVFHQAAIRITQCAEEPRLALEVLVDGTFNVVEAAAQAKVDKLVAASSASVYGLAEEFPTAGAPPPPQQRHVLRRRQVLQRGHGPQLPGDAAGSTTSLLRYFNVYGPRMDVHGLYTEVLVRWMERIADGQPPLIFGDGLQTMDFVFTTRHRPRQRAGRDQPASSRASTTSPAARRPACSAWPRPAAGHGLRPRRRARPRARGQRRRAAPRRHVAPPSATSASSREIGLEDGLRELVEWWRPLREEIAAGRAVQVAS